MKTLLLALAFALGMPFAANAAPMTNDDVIKMVRGGLEESTVIQAIDASAPAFDTSPNGLIRLKQGGVSDTVIQRILSRGSSGAPAYTQQQACPNCGSVVSMREVEKTVQGSAVVGVGRHRTGVAVAGDPVQKHTSGAKAWETAVRMDDGTTHTYTQDPEPRWRSGDRVRVVNGALSPL